MELSNDPETRMNSLQGGQVDVAQVAPSIVKRAKDAGLQILTAPNSNVTIMQLNRTRPFFKNILVRQAMSFAIDRKAAAAAALEGQGQAAYQFPLKDDPAFSAKAEEFFKFDVGKAKELMARSGQGPFSFTALTLNFPEQKAMAEIVKQQLAVIGITMNIQTLQPADISVRWATGGGDATCSLVTTRADYSTLWRSMFAADSSSNPSREAPAGFVEKVNAADNEIDVAARGKLLGEVSYALTEDVAALVLSRDIRGVLADPKLAGYKPSSYPPDEFRGVGVAR